MAAPLVPTKSNRQQNSQHQIDTLTLDQRKTSDIQASDGMGSSAFPANASGVALGAGTSSAAIMEQQETLDFSANG